MSSEPHSIPPDFYRPGVTRGPPVDTAGFAEARFVLTVGRAIGYSPAKVDFRVVSSDFPEGSFVCYDSPTDLAGTDLPNGVSWYWLPLGSAWPGTRFLRAELHVKGADLAALAVSLELSRGDDLEDDLTPD